MDILIKSCCIAVCECVCMCLLFESNYWALARRRDLICFHVSLLISKTDEITNKFYSALFSLFAGEEALQKKPSNIVQEVYSVVWHVGVHIFTSINTQGHKQSLRGKKSKQLRSLKKRKAGLAGLQFAKTLRKNWTDFHEGKIILYQSNWKRICGENSKT